LQLLLSQNKIKVGSFDPQIVSSEELSLVNVKDAFDKKEFSYYKLRSENGCVSTIGVDPSDLSLVFSRTAIYLFGNSNDLADLYDCFLDKNTDLLLSFLLNSILKKINPDYEYKKEITKKDISVSPDLIKADKMSSLDKIDVKMSELYKDIDNAYLLIRKKTKEIEELQKEKSNICSFELKPEVAELLNVLVKHKLISSAFGINGDLWVITEDIPLTKYDSDNFKNRVRNYIDPQGRHFHEHINNIVNGKETVYFGKAILRINFIQSTKNLIDGQMVAIGDYSPPHQRARCLGGFQQSMFNCMNENRYSTIILLFLEWYGSANFDDWAGQSVGKTCYIKNNDTGEIVYDRPYREQDPEH
jgi:hypothetical protein